MTTKTIRQTVTFSAPPRVIYQMLMDSKQHAEFTKLKAKIGKQVGEAFMAYDGYILGTQVELIANKKIVQTWRGSDWPKDHFSIATFVLKPFKKGTRLTFTQVAVPAGQYHSILKGWTEYYWEPMKELLKT